MALLDSIRSPADLKNLDIGQLYALAEEIRGRIIATVTRNGGHLASNLGVVELTLALHRSFDSPSDAIVWDVGHQSYAHKLVTGRASSFEGLRLKGGISGFPKRSESPHDIFDTGHASTSISAALGLLEARRRLGVSGNVVAVIGDGALTGGMAFEALSHAGQLGLPLIIVLNDNKMSISPNVGALSRYLSRLSATARYQAVRRRIDRIVRGLPLVGRWAYDLMLRAKKAAKALIFKENLFSELGFEYAGPIDGHNIPTMMHVFREVRALRRPVVVHVLTRKGKGFILAEEDPTRYHGLSPMACSDEAVEPRSGLTFTEAFSEAIIKRACVDPRLVAVTAAMTKGTGLEAFRASFPERLHDVGIAEQHAVTFAAGLAAGGLRPVVAIYSTFMQRAVDQVFHDVALPGLPVVFAVDRAGAVGEDGETHQGIYDIALFRSLPRLSILAPASAAELGLCLNWALDSALPVMIRYPKAACPREEAVYTTPLVQGRGLFVRRSGADTLLMAMGGLVHHAVEASDDLARRHARANQGEAGANGTADVYALRFAWPIDEDAFLEAAAPYRRIFVLEEGVVSGGIGEYLCALIERRLPRISIRVVGFPSLPSSQGSREELLEEVGLSASGIASLVEEAELGREGQAGRIYIFRAAGEGA
ncbi:MAG TPA: 1-deoxy-D-xylulose-5-phosphate synthase [Rectinemataceae bacterium]|nr:1-deoxy-D-xylulose-5-phosphate synthase [Rectinemataceae bacterium]